MNTEPTNTEPTNTEPTNTGEDSYLAYLRARLGPLAEQDMLDLSEILLEARDGEPLKALAAIHHVRGVLDGWEHNHISEARSDGRSWTRIGQVLGRSRQSMHRSHASRLAG